MARPRKCRRICHLPPAREFRPEGEAEGEVTLTLDEVECLRLLDVEGLTQEQCAAQMEVARATAALRLRRRPGQGGRCTGPWQDHPHPGGRGVPVPPHGTLLRPVRRRGLSPLPEPGLRTAAVPAGRERKQRHEDRGDL